MQAERGYASVLERHVNERGEVDFAALQKDQGANGLPSLESYVQAIAATPLDAAATPDARLAHMVNAYNALSMFNVIARAFPPLTLAGPRSSFFCCVNLKLAALRCRSTHLKTTSFEN